MVKIDEQAVLLKLADNQTHLSGADVNRVLVLLEYLRRLGFAYTPFASGDPGGEYAMRNARKNKSASPLKLESIKFWREKLYEFLVAKNSSGFTRLQNLDEYIEPLCLELFPKEFSSVFVSEGRRAESKDDFEKNIMAAKANPNIKYLREVYDEFSHGAYAIRYARNTHPDRQIKKKGVPLFAKSVLTAEYTEGRNFVDFKILYNMGPDLPSNISGKIYIIGDNLLFIGAETAAQAMFFMVMNYDFKERRHGGLVIRRFAGNNRDGANKEYFSSKVLIIRKKPGDSFAENPGQFELEDLEEINEEDAKALLNLAGNQGRGVMFRSPMPNHFRE